MQQIEAPQTITLDGVTHEVSAFSETIQRLVAIHTEWRNDLSAERLAVAKTEAAIRALDAELTQKMTEELAAKAAEVVAVDTETTDAQADA